MPIVKLPGGSLRDEIREPVYDTIDLTAGAIAQGTRSFYSNIQGKGVSLTNLRQPNLLEVAVSFRIQGLAIDVQCSQDGNFVPMALVHENSAARLRVGEKVYWEGPFRFAGGRMWTDLAASGGGNIYAEHGHAAVASIILTGNHSVDINPLQSFQVDWILEGLTAAEQALATVVADTKLRYICSLKGIKRRPVQ
jgi:hypothetical protein